jgi:predicted RNA binding protein YcfA (HicA-like mRNA interferase family)
MPFHFYHPTWWGIYLIREGVVWLANAIHRESRGVVTRHSAHVVARLFLYGHELFHHAVECFGTRLEVTHWTPLYRGGIWPRFASLANTDDWLEEALATAAGFRKVQERALLLQHQKPEKTAVLEVLSSLIQRMPPGYRMGGSYRTTPIFKKARCVLAEDYHRAALPLRPKKAADIWTVFPHAFHGIGRVNSRVNYLVRANSPLASRINLGLQYFRFREVDSLLRQHGCDHVGSGKGSHVIYRSPSGRKITVPRHPGDLRPGTLKAILRQAGIQVPLSQMANAIT